jgi:soluble lytic murein transglycosylase-like protein
MIPLFVSDVPFHCINEAAIEFNIPAKLIIAILNIEHGKAGQAIRNTNGTYDLGPMQINTLWLTELQKYSITKEDIQFNPCINVKLGAWLLSKAIASESNLLKGIGDYHSHTTKHNNYYVQKVKINYTKINMELNKN